MGSKRTKNSMINIFVIVFMQVLSLLYSLISKRIFLSEFTLSVYGVIDLFSSFFHSLMLLELGFGTILIYNLFKPIALKNDKEIRNQLAIFKTIYFYLIMIIVSISVIFAPFLYDFFNITYQDTILVYIIYFSNVLYIIIKYSTLSKISILNASQEKYIENIAIIIVDAINFVIKVVSVVIFRDIYLYIFSLLVIPSFSYFLEVLWINKHYNVKKIKLVTFKKIKESGTLHQCRNYIYATVYSLVFVAMDNIIISAMLSTDSVAYVTNYNVLLATGTQFITTIMLSLRGVMADYHYNQSSKEGFYDVFNIVTSFNFIIVSLMSVGFYVLMDDFIGLWLGQSFVISCDIFVALLIIRTLECIFEPINNVFIINGYIFKEKLPLIISALTNLFLTIILIKSIGLIGAYIATIIALFIKWYGKFYYVLGGIFNEHKGMVLFRYCSYLCLISFEMIIVNRLAKVVVPSVASLSLFTCKLVFVVFITVLVNGGIILMDKSVRNYMKNLLFNKEK